MHAIRADQSHESEEKEKGDQQYAGLEDIEQKAYHRIPMGFADVVDGCVKDDFQGSKQRSGLCGDARVPGHCHGFFPFSSCAHRARDLFASIACCLVSITP